MLKKTIKFQTNIGHVEKGGLNDFLPEIFYVVLIFLLFWSNGSNELSCDGRRDGLIFLTSLSN